MSDKPILIKNGRIPDRKSGKLIASDILISGGIITALGDIPPKKGCHSVNARGNVIFPAFTDLRTHLFIPPYIRTEDIRTTAAAALAGGYGCLLSAPHAPIPITTLEQIARIIAASGQLPCDIIPVGSVTDAAGKASDFDTLISAGAFALADDSTEDSELIFRTMKYCAENDILLIMHADTGRGQGSFSDYRGGGKNGCVPEDVRCAAILTLAAKSGCRLHISGVSSGCSAKLISIAKREGVNVSADTSPQYFSMTSEDMLFYGNNVKLAPPLRSRRDCEMLIEAICDGTIDAISTDHYPVTVSEKSADFENVPCGMLGLQTAFAVSLTNLVRSGYTDLFTLYRLMSQAPAEILGRNAVIEVGAPGRVAVCDIDKEYEFTESMLRSRSIVRNSPYIGQILTGSVERVIM